MHNYCPLSFGDIKNSLLIYETVRNDFSRDIEDASKSVCLTMNYFGDRLLPRKMRRCVLLQR